MKEIKFRAWDIEWKRFYYLVLTKEGVSDTINRNAPVGKLSEWYQYTGLKDKDDADIYEGDIVRFGTAGFFPKIQGDTRVVEFHDGCYCINGKRHDYMNKTDYILFGMWQTMPEVIGNIYENPELLKE